MQTSTLGKQSRGIYTDSDLLLTVDLSALDLLIEAHKEKQTRQEKLFLSFGSLHDASYDAIQSFKWREVFTARGDS